MKPLDGGAAGAEADFTDLHAWAEVYVPGAGWIGLDPTSGLLAGEGPHPARRHAAAIQRCADQRRARAGRGDLLLRHAASSASSKRRASRCPTARSSGRRSSPPATPSTRASTSADVRLSMGGEPTFVSIDDMEGAEWNTAAVGPTKRRLRRGPGAPPAAAFRAGRPSALRPGQMVPRRAAAALGVRLYWRRDGEPLWTDHDLIDARSTSRQCGDSPMPES